MKSWSLNFLEPYGPAQACYGRTLPFYHSSLTYLPYAPPIWKFGKEYKSCGSSLHHLFQSFVNPNFFLSTLFLYIISLFVLPFCVKISFTPTWKSVEILILYILVIIFLECKLECKNSELNGSWHPQHSTCSWILLEYAFDLLVSFPVSELCPTFKGFITYLHVVILSCMLFTRHEHLFLNQSCSTFYVVQASLIIFHVQAGNTKSNT